MRLYLEHGLVHLSAGEGEARSFNTATKTDEKTLLCQTAYDLPRAVTSLS